MFVPTNAVKDRVKDNPAEKTKKRGAPDMNAAVTSAKEGTEAEKANKKAKRRSGTVHLYLLGLWCCKIDHFEKTIAS